MGIVGLLISRGVRFMSDGLNGPTNEEARELLEIRLEEAQARHAEEMAEALAERDWLSQACEHWSKLDAPLSEFRRVLRVGDYESTLDAAKRISRELEVCLGQLDHVMAREKRTNLEAYALGRKSAEEHEGVRESERKELVARGDTMRDERDDAIARAEKAEADVDALNALIDTERAELAAIRAATGEPTDDALFAADSITNNVAGRRALYNLGRTAAQGEVAMMREAARGRDATIETLRTQQEEQAEEVATLRARVAELEAAPQGQPVATDEELWDVFGQAWRACPGGRTESNHAGALAVAARVRAERPACLVARAVALNVDVRVAEDVEGFLVAAHESPNLDEVVCREVPAADVPATLASLLDEVEAARKAVTK